MKEKPSILCASLMAGPNVENGFTKAIQNTFGEYYTLHPGNKQFNTELVRMVDTYKPSIVFIQIQTAGILLEDVAKYIAGKSFVINFSGDAREQTEGWYYEIGKNIQMSCFSNMRDVKTLRDLGCKSEWLECGVDPEIYKPYPVEKSFDIVAHFNHYGHFPLSNYRLEAVQALKKHFGDRFKVFGNFPNADGNFNHNQTEEAVNYCKAKIAINISHLSLERYSSDRLNRIIGTATPLCLSHTFDGLSDLYVPGKHIDSFSDLNELITKCEYYLDNEEVRRNLVTLAYDHFIKNYTFKVMAQRIKKYYDQGRGY